MNMTFGNVYIFYGNSFHNAISTHTHTHIHMQQKLLNPQKSAGKNKKKNAENEKQNSSHMCGFVIQQST